MNNRIYPTEAVEADAPNSELTFYIEQGDLFCHIEPGFLIIDVTDGDWDTDLWYLVTSVFENRITITPTHVGVTASIKKDGKYIYIPCVAPTINTLKSITPNTNRKK